MNFHAFTPVLLMLLCVVGPLLALAYRGFSSDSNWLPWVAPTWIRGLCAAGCTILGAGVNAVLAGGDFVTAAQGAFATSAALIASLLYQGLYSLNAASPSDTLRDASVKTSPTATRKFAPTKKPLHAIALVGFVIGVAIILFSGCASWLSDLPPGTKICVTVVVLGVEATACGEHTEPVEQIKTRALNQALQVAAQRQAESTLGASGAGGAP
jgi:hypothetical protein